MPLRARVGRTRGTTSRRLRSLHSSRPVYRAWVPRAARPTCARRNAPLGRSPCFRSGVLALWRGSRYDTRPACGAVAQLGERSVRNAEVEGSNPFGSTIPLKVSTPVSAIRPMFYVFACTSRHTCIVGSRWRGCRIVETGRVSPPRIGMSPLRAGWWWRLGGDRGCHVP